MVEEKTVQEAAELQASLDRVKGDRRFVIRNAGSVSAQDVRFEVIAEPGKNPPVSAHDLATAFPVAEMKPGESASLSAIITPGTGLHFRGVVKWKSADGTDEERIFYMSA